MAKRIAILTGGGDCPGLNPAIRGVVLKAYKLGYECVGIQEGWKGMINATAKPISPDDVREMVGRGGTMLGTSRTNPYKKEGGVQGVLNSFKKLDLHALVAMGGEDTLGVANKLFKEHKLNVVGVPKTMDNDLDATDATFGFDTAATLAIEAVERLPRPALRLRPRGPARDGSRRAPARHRPLAPPHHGPRGHGPPRGLGRALHRHRRRRRLPLPARAPRRRQGHVREAQGRARQAPGRDRRRLRGRRHPRREEGGDARRVRAHDPQGPRRRRAPD